ncbi:ribonuclease H-like domain, reverse transcriptase, RNA-dependent DNA polymerase [Tanacetum coccineum]
MLTRSNYAAWAIKMRVFMQAQGVWEAIEPRTRNTAIDVKKDKLALAAIYQGIPEDLLLSLAEKQTAKDAWETLKTMFMGAERVKTAKVQTLKAEFETLSMKDTEIIDDFAMKVNNIKLTSTSKYSMYLNIGVLTELISTRQTTSSSHNKPSSPRM